MSVRERIEARYVPEPNSGCFLWLGSLNTHGYAQMWANGTNRAVHRLYYEMEKGPVAPGLQLDHLCRIKSCINPAHLEPVTSLENAWARGRRRPPSTHCPQGHEMTYENTHWQLRRRNGKAFLARRCKICRLAYRNAEQRRRRRRHGLIQQDRP